MPVIARQCPSYVIPIMTKKWSVKRVDGVYSQRGLRAPHRRRWSR